MYLKKAKQKPNIHTSHFPGSQGNCLVAVQGEGGSEREFLILGAGTSTENAPGT